MGLVKINKGLMSLVRILVLTRETILVNRKHWRLQKGHSLELALSYQAGSTWPAGSREGGHGCWGNGHSARSGLAAGALWQNGSLNSLGGTGPPQQANFPHTEGWENGQGC